MKLFSQFDHKDLKFPLLVFNAEGAKVFAEDRRGMILAVPSASFAKTSAFSALRIGGVVAPDHL